MSDTFKAIRIDKDNETQKVNLVELNENDLMEGDVLVDITHSTLNFKDGLALTGSSPVVRTFPMIPGIDLVVWLKILIVINFLKEIELY